MEIGSNAIGNAVSALQSGADSLIGGITDAFSGGFEVGQDIGDGFLDNLKGFEGFEAAAFGAGMPGMGDYGIWSAPGMPALGVVPAGTVAGTGDTGGAAARAPTERAGGADRQPRYDSRGNLMTANQNEVQIRGENLQRLVDIATRRDAQAYRRERPNVTVYNNIDSPQIYETADYDKFVDTLVRETESAVASSAAD
jgi:hypothetical protein